MRWYANRQGGSKSSESVRPSAKFDKYKADDPFKKKNLKTNFAYVYKCGRIPCRINHGSVRHKLHWDIAPHLLDYDPILLHLAEGFAETTHPYVFIASKGFTELLEAKGSQEKTAPLTKKLVVILRQTLRSTNQDVFVRALDGLRLLSGCVGPEMNPHLASLLVQVNQKGRFRGIEAKINETIEAFAYNGGDAAIKAIKAKVPTFTIC